MSRRGTSSRAFGIPIREAVGVRLSLARSGAAVAIASAIALCAAPAALADTADSTNWAGYSVHGDGVTYRSVTGSWREPDATCLPGEPTYSSFWVGIGGFSQTSQALDQIGTEVDCTASGQVVSSAWYELVPAGAVNLKLAVQPGDLVNARVSVAGKKVTVHLYDVTRKQGFSKTSTVSQVDATSAEWIVEAPSDCIGANACQTLPLANFGTASFTGASAMSRNGHRGGIDNLAWRNTKIDLVPMGRRFFAGNSTSPSIGTATPTPVGADKHSFAVAYSAVALPTLPSPIPMASTARAADLMRAGPIALG
jgi:peptidase A4-like protein